ncbi:MAG: GH32 C-terminal domain-containing protein [Clostridia bacterium]|nr:GH32 C-terminal domain-containing protein [Clostridia bacterium]
MKKIIALLVLALVLTLGISAESGDVNDNGKVDLLDVLFALKQISAAEPSKYADIDGDGNVSVVDGIVLLSRIINDPDKNTAIDVSNKLAFTATDATWSYINGQLVVNSTTGADGFAISHTYIPGGTAFEVEATMQFTEGNYCGGIAFGIASPIKPSVAWYCVNVDRTNKRTRLFSVGTGTVGTNSVAQRPLTDEEIAKDTFTIKIEVTERGKISYYLDGVFVASYSEPDFAGGYIGFNSFKSRTVFKNIKIRTGENSFNENKAIDVVSGNWNYNSGNLTATNSTRGDSFAMTDIYVPAKTAFKVDAKLKVTAGNKTGGIVFGVNDKANPASGWYCLNVAISEKRARLFGVKVGTISATSNVFALSNEKLSQTEFDVSIDVSADGTINCYLDGEHIITGTKPDFAGGYIGFNTYKSNVVFSDIVITVDGVKQTLGDMSLYYGEKSISLDASQTYHYVDIEDYSGKVTIKVDLPSGYTARVGTTAFVGGEYIFTPEYGKNIVKINIRDKYARKSTVTLEIWRDIPEELLYTDTYRPKYHVTPPINFMNDPNGLFYNEATGEYHTYYQWNPLQLKGGNQVWGHAVSKDMLNWTDYGIALDRPADGDLMFSGCAVVDKDNTSGLFDESTAPENRVVALYTATGPFRQELAYSTDGGYTFTKYENNPVIASSAYFASFRDPKVQWIEEKGLWLMVIAGGPMELYTSPDLINWTSQGTMTYLDGTTIESECPMLLALPLDGDENNIKYVYVGSGRFYVVGDLVWEGDSVKFVAEQTKNNTMFYADAHYATQDFYNDAMGRTLVMSWLRDNKSAFLLEDKYWHGMQSTPYVTSLVTENGQMLLKFEPIEEIEGIKGDALCEFADVELESNSLELEDVNAVYGIFDLCAKLNEGATLTLGMREGDGYATTFTFKYLSASTVEVTMNTKNSGLIERITKTATVTCDADGYFSLYALLDNSVIEAFTSDGKVFSDFIFPTADGISLSASGNVLIKTFSVYETK